MKLSRISLVFTAEEIEAIHYAIHIGIRSYEKNKSKGADDWIEKAEEIRRKLPTKLRMDGEYWEKSGA